MFGYRSSRYTYGYDRHEAAVRELQRKARLHFTIRDYDMHGKGRLERSQLVQLLTDTDSSTPPGTPPTEDSRKARLARMFYTAYLAPARILS